MIKTLDCLGRTHRIDLAITASRREDVEQRHFFRSVPQRLMAALSSSLLIVRVRHLAVPVHPRDILVPIIGGSENNAERLYPVSRLAAHFHARYRLLPRTTSSQRASAPLP